jgi:hypothetical protein
MDPPLPFVIDKREINRNEWMEMLRQLGLIRDEDVGRVGINPKPRKGTHDLVVLWAPHVLQV